MTPRDVHDRREFAEAVGALRDSLDAALAAPEPDYERWEEQRGGWWRNWNLVGWVNASHSYRSESAVPIDEELLGTWQTLLPEREGGEQELRDHFSELIEWAHRGSTHLSAEAWDRAFEVMRVGAFWE